MQERDPANLPSWIHLTSDRPACQFCSFKRPVPNPRPDPGSTVAQVEQHAAPAVLLRLEGDARAGWDRMLTAGPGGATLVIAARDGEQLDEMLAGLQEDPAGPRVSSWA